MTGRGCSWGGEAGSGGGGGLDALSWCASFASGFVAAALTPAGLEQRQRSLVDEEAFALRHAAGFDEVEVELRVVDEGVVLVVAFVAVEHASALALLRLEHVGDGGSTEDGFGGGGEGGDGGWRGLSAVVFVFSFGFALAFVCGVLGGGRLVFRLWVLDELTGVAGQLSDVDDEATFGRDGRDADVESDGGLGFGWRSGGRGGPLLLSLALLLFRFAAAVGGAGVFGVFAAFWDGLAVCACRGVAVLVG